MNTRLYNIYDMQSDEMIGTVEATSIIKAEIKASDLFDRYSDEIYALTAE